MGSLMKSKILGLLAAGLLVGPMAANATVIVDTGQPPSGQYANSGGSRAGQFTVGSSFVVDTIESFVRVSAAGDATIFGTVSSVPEPGTLALLGLGLACLGFSRRRRTH